MDGPANTPASQDLARSPVPLGEPAGPAMGVLSNGTWSTLVTASGTGFSTCNDLRLNPWRGDPLDDVDGFLLYIRDTTTGSLASAGHRPIPGPAGSCRMRLGPGRISLERRAQTFATTLDICVPPESTFEIRRLRLTNMSGERRSFEVTSYVEMALNNAAAHAAHPVFSRLFLQTSLSADGRVLHCRRRARSPEDVFPPAFHAVLGGSDIHGETDRSAFVGRGRSLEAPRALVEPVSGPGSHGNVLDPILSLRSTLTLDAGKTGTLIFLLGTAADEAAAEEVAARIGAGDAESLFAAAASAATTAAAAVDGAGAGRRAAVSLCAADADALRQLEKAIADGTWPGLAAPEIFPGAPEGRRGAPEVRPGAPEAPAGAVAAAPAHSPVVPSSSPDGPAPGPENDLAFFNGLGGFDQEGREYVIRLRHDGQRLVLPPLPWINVLANEEFGSIVSETGAGFTWGANSREHRLTPWANDPVLDPPGEVLFVRDEESRRWWSPLPAPAPADVDYEMRHGFGYSHCSVTVDDLEQETTILVPVEDPVRITRIRIRNRGSRPRRLALFSCQRLVLGPGSVAVGNPVVTEAENDILYAHNPAAGEFSGRVAFAAASGRVDSFTTDAAAFAGAGGTPARPAALRQPEPMDGRTGTPTAPCFALTVTIDLPPGAAQDIVFLFGEAENRDQARAIASRYREDGAADGAEAAVERFWREAFDGLRIETPLPALDLMINGWLPYQTLACRLRARSAFYQSGGAFGFRDQLQDSSSLIPLWPEITRNQILLNAAHQFVEGDVMHWWHPPNARGIRTRFADDLLWLPLLAAEYINATGDAAVLDEVTRYLRGPALEPGQDEVFMQPEDSGTSGDLYEHCCRAIDRSLATGAHGLPLFGTGDWNDGMNRVGRLGKGESVWMGFFLYRVLDTFLPFCELRKDTERAQRYADHREALRAAIEANAWDGGWYRRAWYDNGAPLGTSTDTECRIDALVQAWSVLSGAAPADRSVTAMDAVETHLVSEPEQLIRLLTPPFDRTPHDPGYIKGYLPGVRENGGQYTHAALWVIRALAEMGRNNRAARLLDMLSPVNHARTPDQVDLYRVEPYVVAADVYGAPPHIGRGGWTWYTGSSGWMHRVALESILGLRMKGGTVLEMSPCVPDDWEGFTITFKPPGSETCYVLRAVNPNGNGLGVASASVDGRALAVEGGVARIPISNDGTTHQVELVLGGGHRA